MAHSDVDAEIRREWQDDVHGDTVDALAKGWRMAGEGEMIALAVTAYAAGTYAPEAPGANISRNWGERNIRALIVGAPPLVAAQLVTGGSRPGQSLGGSHWSPFADTNGVSGHTFMAAVPCITAAQMTDDLFLKSAFYTASTMTGMARIHEDDHYASQVMLGWLMAYLACDAVTATEAQFDWVEVAPLAMEDGVGVGIMVER
jgi:hypothetical protein